MKKFFLNTSRVLISVLFIFSGVSKLFSWNSSVERLSTALNEWHINLFDKFNISLVDSYISSHAVYLLAVATILEIVGGVLIFFGYKVKIGASLLLVFLIPVTFIMFPIWFHSQEKAMEIIPTILKNFSLIGTFIYIIATTEKKYKLEI